MTMKIPDAWINNLPNGHKNLTEWSLIVKHCATIV